MGNSPACACCSPSPENVTKIGSNAPISNVQAQASIPSKGENGSSSSTAAAASSSTAEPASAFAGSSSTGAATTSAQKGIEPFEKKDTGPTEKGIEPLQKKFMFGRSESKVEELLRGKATNVPQDMAAGTAHMTESDGAASGSSGPPRKRRASLEGGVQVVVTEAPSISDTPTNASRAAGPQNDEPLTLEAVRCIENLFHTMDLDGSQEIKIEEATQFWRTSFASVSAQAMFNEVDADQDGSVILDEFMSFWQGVKQSGYTDDEIMTEIQLLLEGNAWVDWKDQRSTTRPAA